MEYKLSQEDYVELNDFDILGIIQNVLKLLVGNKNYDPFVYPICARYFWVGNLEAGMLMLKIITNHLKTHTLNDEKKGRLKSLIIHSLGYYIKKNPFTEFDMANFKEFKIMDYTEEDILRLCEVPYENEEDFNERGKRSVDPNNKYSGASMGWDNFVPDTSQENAWMAMIESGLIKREFWSTFSARMVIARFAYKGFVKTISHIIENIENIYIVHYFNGELLIDALCGALVGKKLLVIKKLFDIMYRKMIYPTYVINQTPGFVEKNLEIYSFLIEDKVKMYSDTKSTMALIQKTKFELEKLNELLFNGDKEAKDILEHPFYKQIKDLKK